MLTVGEQAQLQLTLAVSGSDTINVTSGAELIETQRSSQSTTVDQERINNLPINGRNYINFTLTNSQIARDAAPSVGAIPTSGLNFGGVRARSNSINVDGADAGDYIVWRLAHDGLAGRGAGVPDHHQRLCGCSMAALREAW